MKETNEKTATDRKKDGRTTKEHYASSHTTVKGKQTTFLQAKAIVSLSLDADCNKYSPQFYTTKHNYL